MSEEQVVDQELAPEEQESEPPRHSLCGLLVIALIVILAIIVLLLLRDCVGAPSGTDESGGKKIEPVVGAKPVAESVSVWLAGSAQIERVLAAASVTPRRITNLGSGRYVVEIGGESATRAAKRIAKQKGVYDAGLVYEP